MIRSKRNKSKSWSKVANVILYKDRRRLEDLCTKVKYSQERDDLDDKDKEKAFLNNVSLAKEDKQSSKERDQKKDWRTKKPAL